MLSVPRLDPRLPSSACGLDPNFPPSLCFCLPAQLPEALDQSWWHRLWLLCSMLAPSTVEMGEAESPLALAATLLGGAEQGRDHPLACVAAPCLWPHLALLLHPLGHAPCPPASDFALAWAKAECWRWGVLCPALSPSAGTPPEGTGMDGGMPVSHEGQSLAASPLSSPGEHGVTVQHGEAQAALSPSTHIPTLGSCGSLWPGWRFAPAVAVGVGPRCPGLGAIAPITKRCPEEKETCCSRGRNGLGLR